MTSITTAITICVTASFVDPDQRKYLQAQARAPTSTSSLCVGGLFMEIEDKDRGERKRSHREDRSAFLFATKGMYVSISSFCFRNHTKRCSKIVQKENRREEGCLYTRGRRIKPPGSVGREVVSKTATCAREICPQKIPVDVLCKENNDADGHRHHCHHHR